MTSWGDIGRRRSPTWRPGPNNSFLLSSEGACRERPQYSAARQRLPVRLPCVAPSRLHLHTTAEKRQGDSPAFRHIAGIHRLSNRPPDTIFLEMRSTHRMSRYIETKRSIRNHRLISLSLNWERKKQQKSEESQGRTIALVGS